jgi:hypothetical protein
VTISQRVVSNVHKIKSEHNLIKDFAIGKEKERSKDIDEVTLGVPASP